MIQARNLHFPNPVVGESTPPPIDFQVQAGESLALVGTETSMRGGILKVLIGLNRTYRGTVHFQGKELQDWSRDYYEEVGCHIAGQPFGPFPELTAEENLIHFAKGYRGTTTEVSDLLVRVGLKDVSGMRVSRFSRGMVARLGLARAVLHQPKALFLDEPLLHVEPEFQESIQTWIREQSGKGCAVVLGLSNVELAKSLTDRQILLEKGSTIAANRAKGS